MSRQMGIGELNSAVFVREFRFVLYGDNLPEHFIFSVNINWTKKELLINAYEGIVKNKIDIHDWANGMETGKHPQESLTLVVFDGAGEELYARRFSDLKIIERKNNFDYSSNEVAKHSVLVSYKECKNTTSKMEFPIIQGTSEVNHLNEKMWIK